MKQNISDRDFAAGPGSGFRIDPWGYSWDATVRAQTTWENADAICKSKGGRLPTITELYRNCHNNPNGFGGSISSPDESYYLWTMIGFSPDNMVAVRLSDGNGTNYTKTSSCYFRCVWPDKEYDTFRKSYVYGPPGEDGFRVAMNGNRFAMDTFDRPEVTYNSAVREAAFYHAFIPPESVFTSTIRDGLPNGSGNFIWTSDRARYDQQEVVGWTGTYDPETSSYADQWSTDASDQTQRYGTVQLPYRCVWTNEVRIR
ncbi:MAG: hypothetical protein JW881_11555 [Spirochaetales bacterium]|nr:hypothetical protein [Spirochaetales bacterium]